MATLQTRPLEWFKPDPTQPRKAFNEVELRSLGESMKVYGQLQPVGAKPDGTLLWGERRYRAAPLGGLKELQVIITDKVLSDSEVRIIQLAKNVHRAALTPNEMCDALDEMLRLNPQWSAKTLAEHVHLDASSITRYLARSKCVAVVREAFAARKIGLADMYAISKVDGSCQPDLLALKLSGANRDVVEKAGRRSRTGTTASVKLTRVKCQLPSGVCIVASGAGLSLDDLIESLGEAQKEAKKARDQGLDAKTLQAVLRNRSKKRSA
jgi:ParB family chromosome partitioning protein